MPPGSDQEAALMFKRNAHIRDAACLSGLVSDARIGKR
jgi:hypothetical protein